MERALIITWSLKTSPLDKNRMTTCNTCSTSRRPSSTSPPSSSRSVSTRTRSSSTSNSWKRTRRKTRRKRRKASLHPTSPPPRLSHQPSHLPEDTHQGKNLLLTTPPPPPQERPPLTKSHLPWILLKKIPKKGPARSQARRKKCFMNSRQKKE